MRNIFVNVLCVWEGGVFLGGWLGRGSVIWHEVMENNNTFPYQSEFKTGRVNSLSWEDLVIISGQIWNIGNFWESLTCLFLLRLIGTMYFCFSFCNERPILPPQDVSLLPSSHSLNSSLTTTDAERWGQASQKSVEIVLPSCDFRFFLNNFSSSALPGGLFGNTQNKGFGFPTGLGAATAPGVGGFGAALGGGLGGFGGFNIQAAQPQQGEGQHWEGWGG